MAGDTEHDDEPFRGLVAPARRALAGAGIVTLEDAAEWSRDDLVALHGFGPTAWTALQKRLAPADDPGDEPA